MIFDNIGINATPLLYIFADHDSALLTYLISSYSIGEGMIYQKRYRGHLRNRKLYEICIYILNIRFESERYRNIYFTEFTNVGLE